MFIRFKRRIYCFIIVCAIFFCHIPITVNANETVTVTYNVDDGRNTPISNLSSDVGVYSQEGATVTIEGSSIVIKGEKGSKVNIFLNVLKSGNAVLCNANQDSEIISGDKPITYSDINCSLGKENTGGLGSIVYYSCLNEYIDGSYGSGFTNDCRIIHIFGYLDSNDVSTMSIVPSGGDVNISGNDLLRLDPNDAMLQNYFSTFNSDQVQQGVVDSQNQAQIGFYNSSNGDRYVTEFTEASRVSNYQAFENAVNDFKDITNLITNFTIALAIITGIITCSINVFKLSTIPAHPIRRREAIIEIGCCFLNFAILGSIKMITYVLISILV